MQVCCTQCPCPCGSPLLTHTSTGDTQTQFCLSLCGVPGSCYAQGLLEPSERLWQEWGLILNVNLPLLLSWWGFSFTLVRGVSPYGHSSTCSHRSLQTMQYYWALIKNELLNPEKSWKNLRYVLLSERRQFEEPTWLPTVYNILVSGERGRNREFLRQWNYSVWYYTVGMYHTFVRTQWTYNIKSEP